MVSALLTALPPTALPASEATLVTVDAHLLALPLVALVAIAGAALVQVVSASRSRRRPVLRVIANSTAVMSRDAA